MTAGARFAVRRGRPEARASSGPVANAWEGFGGWEALFLLAFAVTLVLVVVDGGTGPAAKTTAITLLGLCAVVYLLVGRRAIKDEEANSRVGLYYAGFVIVAFVPATVIAPAASFALFALCPQTFMVLRPRWAVATVLLLNVSPAVRFALQPGLEWEEIVAFAATSTLVIITSMVFGPWITRIIHQSAERGELIEELSASRAEVERLSRERGALAERERLAGEIHDTLAQGFTSIIMLIQAAEAQPDPSRHLALAMRTARESLDEARGLIATLTPAPLDGSTLDEALGRITARLGEELGIPVAFTIEGTSRPLPPGTEVVLIRAAQEGLANVRKHAAASSATVVLTYGDHEVVLRVRDDGTGFGEATPTTGYGLRAMRSRVEQAGGTLRVDGAAGRGTELSVRLPQEGDFS